MSIKLKLNRLLNWLFVRRHHSDMYTMEFITWDLEHVPIDSPGPTWNYITLDIIPKSPCPIDDTINYNTMSFVTRKMSISVTFGEADDIKPGVAVDMMASRVAAALHRWPVTPEAKGHYCFAPEKQVAIDTWKQDLAAWMSNQEFPCSVRSEIVRRRWLVFKHIDETLRRVKRFQVPRPNESVIGEVVRAKVRQKKL